MQQKRYAPFVRIAVGVLTGMAGTAALVLTMVVMALNAAII